MAERNDDTGQGQNARLREAVDLALAGKWDAAHRIAQSQSGAMACWLHAVLHKIEGDGWNARYWYARTPRDYDDYGDAKDELRAIREKLTESGNGEEGTRE